MRCSGHFSPSWRGTSTHARLATRASWARFSTSATVRIRFARARTSVGRNALRGRSPETLYNFPRRRPPPPNRATDGPRTRDADPLPRVSLTHSAAAKVYVGTEVAIGLGLGLIAGAAWKVRLDAAPDVRVPLSSRASLSRARRAKNIARHGRARPSTASRRVEPRLTRPDHALSHAELALVPPQANRGLLQEQLIPRRSVEDVDADDSRVPLAKRRVARGAETRHRAAPRRP